MPNRRQALKQSLTATLALSFPHVLRGAENPRPIIGAGAHRYECIHDWAKLPAGHHFGDATHGVAVDSQGLIYIAHQGTPGSVTVFNPDGTFVKNLMPQHTGNGHGVDIRKEGDEEFIYLTANSDWTTKKVTGFAKISRDGEIIWHRKTIPKSHRYDQNEFFNPTNVSFTPDGGFHLGDGYGSHWIHRFDRDGDYISTFGGPGEGRGQFKTPHGHWLDDRDGIAKLVVCDRANNRLQYVTLDGQHLSFVPGMKLPAAIDIKGDTMVCPELLGGLAIFDKNNEITRIGDTPEWRQTVSAEKNFRRMADKFKPGLFVHPHDAAFDQQGNIILTEWVAGGRITFLRRLT
jgi:hypothetical protein